jgi:3-oxoacyl-[acyl-carrier protein] reductase
MSSREPRTALLTGTNRGTGLAIAEELHRRGYRVVAINRTLGGQPWLIEVQCDLVDHAALERAVEIIMAAYGRLDICVFNAVVRRLGRLAELERAAWSDMIAVNVLSVVSLIRSTLPAMRANRGKYVIMGSHAGSHYFEGGAAYSATKAALKAVVETLLLEERANGVRATLVSPGAIANRDTDDSAYKMAPASVARLVGILAQEQPEDLVVGDIEIRPSRLRESEITGLDRLQHV